MLCVGFAALLAVWKLGALLSAGDPLRPPDALVVLSGEDGTRLVAAAELWQRGIAPVLVVTWACEPARRVPTRWRRVQAVTDSLEVPHRAVRLEGVRGRCVENTDDEAMVIRELAQRAGWKRVRVVTNWYHGRRARIVVERQTRNSSLAVDVSSVPSWRYGADDWWRFRSGWSVALREVAKLLLTRVRRSADPRF